MLVLNMNLQKIIIYNPIVVVEHNEYWGHHCNNSHNQYHYYQSLHEQHLHNGGNILHGLPSHSHHNSNTRIQCQD